MGNNYIIFISVLLIVVISIYLLFEAKTDKFPYRKKEFLLSIPERKFFEELQKMISDNQSVFPQVPLSAIVSVYASRTRFWQYQNKINRKTLDYVIFEKPFLKPLLAIEYDGKTHDQPSRIKRDITVGKILDSAGIKILHVKHKQNIDFNDIRNQIEEILLKKD